MVDALTHQEDYSLLSKLIVIFLMKYFCKKSIFPSHPHTLSESNDGISVIFLPVVPYCNCTCWVHVDTISVSCMSHCFVFYHLIFSSITYLSHRMQISQDSSKTFRHHRWILFCFLFICIELLKLLTVENAQSILLHIYFQSIVIVFVTNVL